MPSSCDQVNPCPVSGKGTLWLGEGFVSSDFRPWLPFRAVAGLSMVAEDTAASLAGLGQTSARHETGAPSECVGRASLNTFHTSPLATQQAGRGAVWIVSK